jgi:hypothetical protein
MAKAGGAVPNACVNYLPNLLISQVLFKPLYKILWPRLLALRDNLKSSKMVGTIQSQNRLKDRFKDGLQRDE